MNKGDSDFFLHKIVDFNDKTEKLCECFAINNNIPKSIHDLTDGATSVMNHPDGWQCFEGIIDMKAIVQIVCQRQYGHVYYHDSSWPLSFPSDKNGGTATIIKWPYMK